jgi:hypothetical protein
MSGSIPSRSNVFAARPSLVCFGSTAGWFGLGGSISTESYPYDREVLVCTRGHRTECRSSHPDLSGRPRGKGSGHKKGGHIGHMRDGLPGRRVCYFEQSSVLIESTAFVTVNNTCAYIAAVDDLVVIE